MPDFTLRLPSRNGRHWRLDAYPLPEWDEEPGLCLLPHGLSLCIGRSRWVLEVMPTRPGSPRWGLQVPGEM